MNEHWKGYPDYWSDFELRDVVETIWNNYHDKIKDLESFLSQIDDSKSVLTLSHKIRRTWLRLKWDMNTNVAHYTGTGRLLEIPNLVDDDYNEVDIPFQVDAENNTVILDADESMLEPYKTIDEDGRWSVKLWAPVYYIHNPVINKFYAPLLGIDELEETYARSYGIQPWSETYYRIVKGLWYVFTNGPTIENIRIGLFILFNIPFALRAGTVVRKIDDTGRGTSILEIRTHDGTELNDRWEFSNNFYCPFNVGDYVEAFTPLVAGGVEIVDYLNSPDWWEVFPESSTKEKIAIIEKFCTCLIKVDGVSFFRDQLVSEGEIKENIPELYEAFTTRILPTFVKALILLYQVWVDHVDEPIEVFAQSGTLNWYHTPYMIDGKPVGVGWFPNLNRLFHDVDPYAKFDGVALHRGSKVDERGWVVLLDEELKYDSLPEGHVLYDRRRLWVPQYSKLEELYVEDGTPVRVISRGHNWIDVDYIGDSPIHVVYRDFIFPDGLSSWERRVEVTAETEGYIPTSKQLVIPGEDVIVVHSVSAQGVPLQEGVDFTFEYDRLDVGEGQILLHFAEVQPAVEFTIVEIPYALYPVDENGERIFDAIGKFFQDDLHIRGIYDPTLIHPFPSETKYPSEVLYPRGA